VVRAYDGLAFGEREIEVRVEADTGYWRWAAGALSAVVESVSGYGMREDLDGDGLDNGMEMALMLDPLVANEAGGVLRVGLREEAVAGGGRDMIIEFERHRAALEAVEMVPWAGGDLVGWAPLGKGEWLEELIDDGAGDAVLVRWRVREPDGAGRRFYEARVRARE
jgi:hypothetical protein